MISRLMKKKDHILPKEVHTKDRNQEASIFGWNQDLSIISSSVTMKPI